VASEQHTHDLVGDLGGRVEIDEQPPSMTVMPCCRSTTPVIERSSSLQFPDAKIPVVQA
jgi:hypothetical protein